MLFISSPAKRLDFSSTWNSQVTTRPIFSLEANKIASILEKKSIEQLSRTMRISKKLAELNFKRYKSWDSGNTKHLKPAILAYQGDVYKALDVNSLGAHEKKYLQNHLRIITGMYGVLHPYDLIQAYRLEMRLKVGDKNIDNLYTFWSKKITIELNTMIETANHAFCINVASQEYSKVLDLSSLLVPLINISFTQMKNGVVKSIGIHNKRARGLLIRFAAQNKSNCLEDLAAFSSDGYKLVKKTDGEMVFLTTNFS